MNTQTNEHPIGFTRIDLESLESSIESKLKSELLPLVQNKELLKGAVLMAFATLSDTTDSNEIVRAESFACLILSKVMKDVLKIELSDEQLIASPVCCDAIGAITAASLELATQGLLVEESVSYDACPYLRVRDNHSYSN